MMAGKFHKCEHSDKSNGCYEKTKNKKRERGKKIVLPF